MWLTARALVLAGVRAADLGCGSSGSDYDSLLIDQLAGQESDVAATPYDAAATDQPSRFGRAQELDVKIGGRCVLSFTERRHQRRAKGGIEHGGQEAALHHSYEVQEPLGCGEGDLDSPCVRVHGDELKPQRHRRTRECGSTFDAIPERATSRHWHIVAEPTLPSRYLSRCPSRAPPAGFAGYPGLPRSIEL
jgi:hypothetical protein